MSTVALKFEVHLTDISCGSCGGTYAINERYRQEKETQGGFWTCPYCKCSWGYRKGDTETEQLKRQLAEEKERKATALFRANLAERELIVAEKKLKRVKHGVCPCCNRSFAALQAHIKNKHPEFLTK